MRKSILSLLLGVLLLSGCESMYYDCVMDKSDKVKGARDDSSDRASDVSRVGRYH